jgi:glycosyltransferase involved in cell wall biosynthesis
MDIRTVKQKTANAYPLVSVIIPTFFSSKTLETCLRSIRNQSYQNIEAIVVDAFSHDGTREIAEKLGAKVFLLADERSPARNFGVRLAKGRFVLLVDSDMELTLKVAEECVAKCLSEDADAVIIPEESVGRSFLARCKKLEKGMRRQEFYFEAPRFFKKEVYDLVGGYDENLVVGEDFELTQRLRTAGFAIGRCEARIGHHEENVSLKSLTAKLYYYGKKLPTYVRKEPSLSLKTSSPVHLVKNLSLLRKQPMYFAGLCSLKLVEYTAYFVGASVNVLFSAR